MKNRSFFKNLIFGFTVFALCAVFCACSDGSRENVPYEPPIDRDAILNPDDEETSDSSPDLSAVDTDVQYMVTGIDTEKCIIAVNKLGTDRTYQYRYDDSTIFLNKYSDYIDAGDLRLGRIIYLGRPNEDAVLTLVKLSGEAWYQENIHNFEMHADEGYMLLGQTKYKLDENTRVFVSGEESKLSDVSDIDTITVQGQDRQIYSIRVTKSHGTLILYNTELFEGGWLSLGTGVYTTVAPDMTMDLPVGKYMLSVANKGYGDTKKVKIKRGQVTKVDLGEYEGEGPEKCVLTFEMGIEDAVLSIDGEEIDTTQTAEVEYGIHVVTVNAPGYEPWEKKLVVHSGSATITIGDSDLTSDGTGDEADSDTSGDDSGSEEDTAEDADPDEDADTGDESTSTGDESTSTGSLADATSIEELNSAYLSSLADLLDSLTTDD